MSVKAHFLCLILIGSGASSSLRAHDMWLVPKQSATGINQTCEIEVAVGMDFPNSLSSIAPERLNWLTFHGSSGVTPLDVQLTENEKSTTCRFKATEPGIWIIGCTTRPNQIVLAAKKFNDYLLHDGLPHILAVRLDRDELQEDATEQYSKYTKTMIAVGEKLTNEQLASCKQPLGHELEILLLESPLKKRPGDTLAARVLYKGNPLPSANLCWDHPGNGEKFTGQTWTDSQGVAIVPVSSAGMMTLRLVHMTRPQSQTHEWESFWSSFTFDIPEEQ